ncbi:MAG TPA: hypothetical protein PL048_03565 [Leptospiraceae bacterium]|nr:hypothetical protein [Leptospiraceae bacterium]HMY66141.1 hypothetical protein [Leptospiraceae bacterium]HMZ57826.1 hypothetical protein [Leptospiraceae bacterium]HNF13759.1 hypothetical protein [Leptospiraceae bacterium]HNF23806.1 hypothetical protein [Leptospiraceae bacterium]
MKYIFSLVFIVIFCAANYQIYSNTKKKTEIYRKSPPFLAFDHTRSNSSGASSSLKNIIDRNPFTAWEKQNSRSGDWDLDVELDLTHRWNGEFFQSNRLNEIVIVPCAYDSAPKTLKVFAYIREAINVDKDLRLPVEQELYSDEIELEDRPYVIDLEDQLKLNDSRVFPEGIYIAGIKLASMEKTLQYCISDIYMK